MNARRLAAWAVRGLLATWALWVALEFQTNHPVPWRAWGATLAGADLGRLAPNAPQMLASGRHLLAATLILLATAGLGAWAVGLLWGTRGDTVREGTGPGLAADTTRSERFWLATACGFALFATTAIALAAVGLLRPGVLRGVVVVCAVAGAPRLLTLLRPPASPEVAEPYRRIRWFVTGTIAVGILATMPRALSPLVLFDAHVYHLALPRVYLEAGRFVSFPNNVFANAPHSMAMVYAFALSFGGEEVAKLLHGACGLGMLALTAGLGRRIAGAPAGVLAALLTFSTPLFIEHWSTAYTELAMGFAFTAALWAVWYWIGTNHPGALRVAALVLGWYAGVKYTALSGIVGLSLALAVVLIRRRAAPRDWVRTITPFVVGLAIGAGPWLIKNALFVGNPIYPMATGLFGLGPRFPSEVARMAEVVALHGMGREPLDLALLPWRITVYGDHGSPTFDGTIPPLWLMAVPLLLVRRDWPAGTGFLALVAMGYFAAWAPVVHITRYLIPAFPAFSILTVLPLLRWTRSLRVPTGKATPAWPIWAALAATALWWLPPIVTRVVWDPITFGPVAWGHMSREAMIQREEQTGAIYAWMDEHLPPNAAVLGLWENRMYRCPRRLETDGVFWASRWVDRFAAADDLAAFGADLRARGLTHMLFNARFQPAFMPLSPTPEDEALVRRGLARIRGFLDRQCVLLHEANGLRLYRIRRPVEPARASGGAERVE